MNIAVLGAGTWGIALAKLLSENRHSVTVWSALPGELESLENGGKHKNLPDVDIPREIKYERSLEKAVRGKDAVLFTVASAYVRQVVSSCATYLSENQLLIDAAKGLEADTLFTMTEVIEDEMKKCGVSFEPKLIALSGPTHAEEVARNIPTSVVSACSDESCAEKTAELFMNSCMRVYTNTDVKGVEICGAFKNIIALAAGMIRGMGYGDNTLAMLMTRGIAEMTRIGLALGCKRRTFMGLAGIGDLIVTCTSRHSRNNRCGELIGMGLSYEEASKKVGMVVEGYYALDAAAQLCEKYSVSMPIISAVYDVIKRGADPKETVHSLMTRAMRSELD